MGCHGFSEGNSYRQFIPASFLFFHKHQVHWKHWSNNCKAKQEGQTIATDSTVAVWNVPPSNCPPSSAWRLHRKSTGPPLLHFIVPPFQITAEEAASCFNASQRSGGQSQKPPPPPLPLLFIRPLTWREETGRQGSGVCEDNWRSRLGPRASSVGGGLRVRFCP